MRTGTQADRASVGGAIDEALEIVPRRSLEASRRPRCPDPDGARVRRRTGGSGGEERRERDERRASWSHFASLGSTKKYPAISRCSAEQNSVQYMG